MKFKLVDLIQLIHDLLLTQVIVDAFQVILHAYIYIINIGYTSLGKLCAYAV